MAGNVLRNRYRVLRRLGAGGVGSVYMVEELLGGRGAHLALKALFTEQGQETLLASLRLEFRVLATLRHPLIARVYDFGSVPSDSGLEGSKGRPGYFFTRDLIDGRDLEEHCRELSLADKLLLCQRTAEVLDVLHRAGMVHGDFKPANVIVSEDGRPHLIDFGLVRSEGQTTQTGGTAAYLAPELLRGQTVDRRADLYALGISIYQLVTGKLPLPDATFGELMAWHLDGEPVRISPVVDVPAEIPEELDEVVARLTDRDPDQRYPSSAEAALALGEAAVKAGAERRPSATTLFVPPAPGENLTAPLVELEAAIQERTLRRSAGPFLIAVEGEPGAGKSTLLQELGWRCQLAGVEVIWGECRGGDPRAYGLWIDLLSQVAGAVGKPHPLAGSAAAGPQPSRADRFGLYQQITDYLSESAEETPLLLLLDSVEQADEESRAVIRYVAHTIDADLPVAVVAAYRRSDELHRELGAPPRKLLDPLSQGDIRRMAADAAGRTVDELATQIQEHTGGNPQFVIEVLRRLNQAGWPASPDLQQLAPPAGLEQMYAQRWQELGATEQLVLLTLAALGRPAAGKLLMAITSEVDGERQREVGLPLERLEALAWLDRTPDGAHAFRQAPAARIVYSHGDPDQRKEIHLAATQILKRGGAGDPVELTRHAIGAGRRDLALQTLDQAIDSLKSLGALRSAIQLYVDVSELGPEAAILRRIRLGLGDLYHGIGDYESAVRELDMVVEEADGGELNTARIALARVHRSAGRSERALELLAQVRGSIPSREQLVRAQAEAAAAHLALDAYEQVTAAVDEALAVIGNAPSGSELTARAELHGYKAVALGYLQRPDEATSQFEAALRDARQGGDREVEAGILNRRAILAFRQADFASLPERYGAALECARDAGNIEQVARIRLNLATFHMQRGEYAACLEHLTESLRLFEAIGATESLAAARCNMGYIQLKLGLHEQARATLRKALEESRQARRRSGEALALLLRALVQARRGRFDEARKGIAEARALYLELGQTLDDADALLDLAEVELASGQVDQALDAIKRAANEVELDRVPNMKIRAATLRARLAAIQATEVDKQEAASALAEALEAAEEMEAPELTWECHAAAVELFDARGMPDRATTHATLAAEILERMAADLPGEVRTAFWQDPRRRELRRRAAPHRPDSATDKTMMAPSDPATEMTLPVVPASGSDPPVTQTSPTLVQERFYRLLEIYRQINSELDQERLLALVMDTAVELTGAERGFLLLGERPETLEVEVARNIDPSGEQGAFSRSIAEQVFSSGEPVITVSARNDPRFSQIMSVHQLQLESVLCIPIHARDRTAGVLYMESRFQSGRFTPGDQRLLMAFGDQVAIALTNARLLADNINKARELERAKREIEALADERGRLLNQRTQQLEEAKRDLAETRRQLETRVGMFGMIGRSPAMMKLFELIERVAATDVPVLIEGESGTGKEMVARAIHGSSERKKKRLVSVNCAAIPENLLESELFGHVRGAFTGADRERKGLFTAAHGGSLFLDEIGDMPMRMQVDLLRALQEKTIRPIGAQQDIKVDVRVLAASNRPLPDLVRAKRFREDLYYRLNVVTLKLPPLRERIDDIPLLCDHFLSAISAQMKSNKKRLTRTAQRQLMDYSWPGNVRQLEHTLMNATVLADGDILDGDDFTLEAPSTPLPSPAVEPAGQPAEAPATYDRKERERQQILEALEAANWNKTRAAKILDMPRRTFYRRLKEHQIQ
jgi:transcriptional regulator with GAF, ATPase, and Fis domain/tetratricopeptide (TPR) repeat protein